MEERSGINNLVGIDYSFLASFIVSPVLNTIIVPKKGLFNYSELDTFHFKYSRHVVVRAVNVVKNILKPRETSTKFTSKRPTRHYQMPMRPCSKHWTEKEPRTREWSPWWVESTDPSVKIQLFEVLEDIKQSKCRRSTLEFDITDLLMGRSLNFNKLRALIRIDCNY
jgi:hypothetical protein